MKTIHEIDNVAYSMNVNSKLGLIRERRFQVFDLDTLRYDEVCVPNECKQFYTFGDAFLVPDVKNHCTWVIDKGETKKLDSLLSMPANIEQRSTKDYFYPLDRDLQGNRRIAKVDKRDFSIAEHYSVEIGSNGVSAILNDDSFLSINGTSISAYEIKTNKEIWSNNFDDLMRNRKGAVNHYFEPVINNDSAYIYLTDSECSSNFSVVRINIRTGNTENEFEKVGGVLVKHNNSIYTVRHKIVQAINFESNTLRIHDYTEQLRSMEISMFWDRFTLKDNLLYFIHGYHLPSNSFGVANLDTNAIVENMDFPTSHGAEFVHTVKEINSRVVVRLSEDKLMIIDK